MNTFVRGSGRRGRILASIALISVLPFTAVACSGSNGSTATATSTAASDPKTALVALNAGLKAHAAGDLAVASTEYNRALKFDKTNKYALYNLALIDEANGNYGLAEDKYRSALKTDAKYEPALFNLAILRTTPDAKEAISLYQRAVASDKKDAAALLNLGLLLRANGQKAVGDKDVVLAIAMDPRLKDPASASKGTGVKSPSPTASP